MGKLLTRMCQYRQAVYLILAYGWWRSSTGKVTASLAKSNGSLPPGAWLKVTCGLTACLYIGISSGAQRQSKPDPDYLMLLIKITFISLTRRSIDLRVRNRNSQNWSKITTARFKIVVLCTGTINASRQRNWQSVSCPIWATAGHLGGWLRQKLHPQNVWHQHKNA